MSNTPVIQIIQTKKQDAVLWLASRYKESAGDSPTEQAQYVHNVARLLSFVPSETLQDSYIDYFTKTKNYSLQKRTLKNALNQHRETTEAEYEGEEETKKRRFPKWFDHEEAFRQGYTAVKEKEQWGYWGINDKGFETQITTFLMKPIFNVIGKGDDSRHIVEIMGRVKTGILDVKSSTFTSKDKMMNEVPALGAVIRGSSAMYLGIADPMLDHFPPCFEITEPGWQREGFLCYLNKIVLTDGTQLAPDRYGIFKVGEQNFLIPAASAAYEGLRDDDAKAKYEAVNSLVYVESKVSFSQWAKQMHICYKDAGRIGVAYALVTAFRDFIFKINGNVPHLYAFGPTSTGKSKFGESVSSIFTKKRIIFQLNSGTDFAFNLHAQAMRNVPAQYNEFDEKACKEEWFQTIKAMFDGQGRMRGKMNGGRNDVEVQKVNCTLILMGQFLVTKDDNSVVNRSILVPFHKSDFSAEEKKQYSMLEAWEEEGITSLSAAIICHRAHIETHYRTNYAEILSVWRKMTTGDFNARIFQNWCHLATLWHLLSDRLGLPGMAVDFEQFCYQQAKHYSTFIRRSDTLTKFWNTVIQLLDAKTLIPGWHFKVEVVGKLKLRDSDGKESEVSYDEPKKVVFMRLDLIHGLYQEMFKKRNGEAAMSMENLKHYLHNRDYLLGQVKQMQFKKGDWKDSSTAGNEQQPEGVQKLYVWERKNTSAYVFDFDLLNLVDLESEEQLAQPANPF